MPLSVTGTSCIWQEHLLHLKMVDLRQVPERIAYLSLLFMHHQLNAFERHELDLWVQACDENLSLFEELIDIPTLSQHDLED